MFFSFIAFAQLPENVTLVATGWCCLQNMATQRSILHEHCSCKHTLLVSYTAHGYLNMALLNSVTLLTVCTLLCVTQHTTQSVTLSSAGRELEACPAADRPPLWGIPFAVKDNIDVAGFKTTAACKDFAYMPEKSAAAVQALLQAGDKH